MEEPLEIRFLGPFEVFVRGQNQWDLRMTETHRNRLRRNGKEGVNGSSPLEGLRRRRY